MHWVRQVCRELPLSRYSDRPAAIVAVGPPAVLEGSRTREQGGQVRPLYRVPRRACRLALDRLRLGVSDGGTHTRQPDDLRRGVDGAVNATHLPQSFLVYRRYLYLKASVLVALVTLIVYYTRFPSSDHRGGSTIGYTLGIVAAVLMVWLTWFSRRKRRYAPARV